MADFPNRLYELRKARKWSQQELADRAGCSKMHVSGIERGKREFSLQMMRRFADVFGVSPADLLSQEDNPDRLSSEERELIEHYRSAKPEGQVSIQRVADAMVPFKEAPRDAA